MRSLRSLYKLRPAIGFALCALLVGPASAQATAQTFQEPAYKGYRLDACLHWAQQCGEPAATRWCQEMGYEQAARWTFADNIGARSPTLVLGDGRLCSGADCDGFSSITCTKAAEAPGAVAPTTTLSVPEISVRKPPQTAVKPAPDLQLPPGGAPSPPGATVMQPGQVSVFGAISVENVDDEAVPLGTKASIYADVKPHVVAGSGNYPTGRIVVIPVETSDFPRNAAVDYSAISHIFFGICGISDYFAENSWGAFRPTSGGISDWVKINKKLSDYSDPESGPELKRDALKLANIDWNKLDLSPKDGIITSKEVVLVFLFANGVPNGGWASTRGPNIGKVSTPKGELDFGAEPLVNFSVKAASLGDSADNPFRTWSTLAHELSHAWFNLIDRYAGFAGVHDIMSADRSFKHLTLYDKMMIGWIRPKFVSPQAGNRLFEFWPSADAKHGLVLIDPSRPSEYWVMEFRLRSASICERKLVLPPPNGVFDSGLPEDGLAVYWVKRQTFAGSTWAGYDDLRLADASKPDQDPDGSGFAINKDNKNPLPANPNPGYAFQQSGAFFSAGNAQTSRRLYFGDGTQSPFAFRIFEQGHTVKVFIGPN